MAQAMTHLLFTLKNCPYELLDDENYVRQTVEEAADIAHATILNLASHKFEPHGVTCVAMLAESHISIHTWPEHGKAVCDVFTCGEQTMPGLAMLRMRELFGANITDDHVVSRHLDEQVTICYDK